MQYIAINDSNQEVMPIERVNAHLRLASPFENVESFEDELVKLYLDAAVDYVEKYTGIPLLTKKVKMTYSDSKPPYGFKLKFHTAASAVTSIKYRDAGGSEQTFAINNTYINNVLIPNEVFFKQPLPESATNIVIEYDVTPTITPMVPAGLKSAILILTAHMYDKRSATGNPKFMEEINNILKIYKIRWHQ